MDYKMIKYPRTPHIEGSRLQPGDEDLSQVPFEVIAGKYMVVEEKIDGANSAISFDDQGKMYLQSRGHFLTGGYRERHYDLFKQWAGVHRDDLYAILGDRYVMYGEWMYAKHTVFYDKLPHYFMEFDILDRVTGKFLDTASRREMTALLPVASVPVLGEGRFMKKEEVMKFLGTSGYISERHMDALREVARCEGVDEERVCSETENSRLMEGLYIKIEENGEVVDRVKFVRHGFHQALTEANSHWLERPIIPNQITCTINDLFLSELPGQDVMQP